MISEIKGKTTESTTTKLVSIIKRFARRMPRSVFDTKCASWNVRNLKEHSLQVTPAIPVSVDFSDFDETRRWIETLNIPELLNPRDEEIAIREGHYWGNAKYQGKIIGCIKLCVNSAYIPDFRKMIRLPKEVTYYTDLYVLPEHRGKRVAPYLNDRACEFMKGKGFAKEIGFNEEWNTAAKSMDAKIGRKVKRIRYVKILCFKFFTRNPVRL